MDLFFFFFRDFACSSVMVFLNKCVYYLPLNYRGGLGITFTWCITAAKAVTSEMQHLH